MQAAAVYPAFRKKLRRRDALERLEYTRRQFRVSGEDIMKAGLGVQYQVNIVSRSL